MANIEREQMNHRIRIYPLSSANDFLGGQMSGYRPGQVLLHMMGKYPWRQINLKLASPMKVYTGNENATTLRLLFSQKGLEILHRERRGQVNTIVMEHFNSILLRKSGPANKQYTYQSINQSIPGSYFSNLWTVLLRLLPELT